MLDELNDKVRNFINEKNIAPNTLLIGDYINRELSKNFKPLMDYGTPKGNVHRINVIVHGSTIMGLNVVCVSRSDYFEVAHV